MPKPLAICIEDLDAGSASSRYVRCVAIPGRQPGLRLDRSGAVLWQSDDAAACELWVSADDCLILNRPEGAAAVTVRRAGRSLDVPCDKPVELIDQDEIDVGPRHLRLHVHGEGPAVAPPSPFVPEGKPLGRLARAAAAAMALGAIAAPGGCEGGKSPDKGPIHVRERVPEVSPEPKPTDKNPPLQPPPEAKPSERPPEPPEP